MIISNHMVENKKLLVNLLFAVAALQAVLGVIYWHFYSNREELDWRKCIFAFSAPLYVALGLAARRAPSTARRAPSLYLAIGFGLNILLFAFIESMSADDAAALKDGRILQFPISILLMWGAWVVFNLDRLAKRRPEIGITSAIKAALHLLGIMVSAVVLILSYWDLDSMATKSIPEKVFAEMAHDVAQKAKMYWILSVISSCVLSWCIPRLWSETAKWRRKPKNSDSTLNPKSASP